MHKFTTPSLHSHFLLKGINICPQIKNEIKWEKRKDDSMEP